jgi:hypothetical protein
MKHCQLKKSLDPIPKPSPKWWRNVSDRGRVRKRSCWKKDTSKNGKSQRQGVEKSQERTGWRKKTWTQWTVVEKGQEQRWSKDRVMLEDQRQRWRRVKNWQRGERSTKSVWKRSETGWFKVRVMLAKGQGSRWSRKVLQSAAYSITCSIGEMNIRWNQRQVVPNSVDRGPLYMCRVERKWPDACASMGLPYLTTSHQRHYPVLLGNVLCISAI